MVSCLQAIPRRVNLRLAGTPSTIRPTRRLEGPSFSIFLIPSAPIKFPVSLRSLAEKSRFEYQLTIQRVQCAYG